ncbi:hypothetical protein WJX73_002278 [Symbiochloris irregularis]|uniref:Glycoside hydrolase family 2 immunoglobulin-like beta-sandwich domain-containing protein n=1 Tax=Symbiochloris irregularis TaxID=706552 RepID=A0AAW1PW22_9CHLO
MSWGYPRPQMVRLLPDSAGFNFFNLNGKWQYALHAPGAKLPFGKTLKDSIIVPFPPESFLSGLQTMPNFHMFYRRMFQVGQPWDHASHSKVPTNIITSPTQELLLNFGAVDWQARVFVDQQHVCSHRGGYSRFTCAISSALSNKSEHELILDVHDPTEFGQDNLFGKQRSDAAENLTAAVLVTDPQRNMTVGSAVGTVGTPLTINITNPRLWSTSDPFLYDVQVALKNTSQPDLTSVQEDPLALSSVLSAPAVDTVSSYAGVRTVSKCLDRRGLTRFCLNGQPTFLNGLLDQGMWPDGLYTAPADEAHAFDIGLAQQAGFNMLRKHVKVEPDVWFAYTDKMGTLVIQDIPSPVGSYFDLAGPTEQCCYPVAWNSSQGYNNVVTPAMRANYLQEVKDIVEQHMSSPSLVAYILFNEGWGQPLDTAQITREVMALDRTRLFNSASGWNNSDQYLAGDFLDLHDYSPLGPTALAVGGTNLSQLINVIGEWGSVGFIIPERPIYSKNVYIPNYALLGFDFTTWLQRYEVMLATIAPQLTDPKYALSGLVYTELTDAAFDITGLCTYDRIVIKISVPVVAQLNARMYELFAA